MPDEFLKGRRHANRKEASRDCQQEAQARLPVFGATACQIRRGGEANVIRIWPILSELHGLIFG